MTQAGLRRPSTFLNIGSIEAKSHIEPPRARGTKIRSYDSGLSTKMGRFTPKTDDAMKHERRLPSQNCSNPP